MRSILHSPMSSVCLSNRSSVCSAVRLSARTRVHSFALCCGLVSISVLLGLRARSQCARVRQQSSPSPIGLCKTYLRVSPQTGAFRKRNA